MLDDHSEFVDSNGHGVTLTVVVFGAKLEEFVLELVKLHRIHLVHDQVQGEALIALGCLLVQRCQLLVEVAGQARVQKG